jgi:hypothetical protein
MKKQDRKFIRNYTIGLTLLLIITNFITLGLPIIDNLPSNLIIICSIIQTMLDLEELSIIIPGTRHHN